MAKVRSRADKRLSRIEAKLDAIEDRNIKQETALSRYIKAPVASAALGTLGNAAYAGLGILLAAQIGFTKAHPLVLIPFAVVFAFLGTMLAAAYFYIRHVYRGFVVLIRLRDYKTLAECILTVCIILSSVIFGEYMSQLRSLRFRGSELVFTEMPIIAFCCCATYIIYMREKRVTGIAPNVFKLIYNAIVVTNRYVKQYNQLQTIAPVKPRAKVRPVFPTAARLRANSLTPTPPPPRVDTSPALCSPSLPASASARTSPPCNRCS